MDSSTILMTECLFMEEIGGLSSLLLCLVIRDYKIQIKIPEQQHEFKMDFWFLGGYCTRETLASDNKLSVSFGLTLFLCIHCCPKKSPQSCTRTEGICKNENSLNWQSKCFYDRKKVYSFKSLRSLDTFLSLKNRRKCLDSNATVTNESRGQYLQMAYFFVLNVTLQL